MSDPRTSWRSAREEGYRTTRMVAGLLLALVLAGLATVTWAATAAHGSDKVTICHADQGKPGWKQITVSVDALDAHRAHQWGADLIPAPAGGCPGTTPISEPSWTPTPSPASTAAASTTATPSPTSTPQQNATPTTSPSPSTPDGEPSTTPGPSSPPQPQPSTPTPSAPSTPSPTPTASNPTTTVPVSTATSTPSASPTPIAVVLDSATTDQLAETGAGNVVGLFLIAIGLLGSGAALWVDAERKKAGEK